MEAQLVAEAGDTPLPLQSDGEGRDIAPGEDNRRSEPNPAPKDVALNGKRSRIQPPAKDGKISNRTGKGRTNSLRRVKNSSELLRQRSLKRSKTDDIMLESAGNPGGREGRHFTVSNVGHNGKIYLRPVINQVQTRRNLSPFPHSPITPPDSAFLRPDVDNNLASDTRHSIWSNSQLSELHPGHILQDQLKGSRLEQGTVPTPLGMGQRPSTSSTQDDQHPSPNSKGRRELRIVIERADPDRPKSAEEPAVPALEIPIPHYRLGGFRFSADGTPVLRSSVYTRTSVSDNFRSSTFLKIDPDTPFPHSQTKEAIEPRQPHPFVPSPIAAPRTLSGFTTSPTHSSVFYKLQEPIEASIFDDLMAVIDDPSVVRYAGTTNEISAATPARIVAQISSDSFMDYELVSDFFLTFRSYLSPNNLVSLLLARLQWAINRREDDGRIIRIRVFAALRHWILNYFVDDFVLNRDLRVQFCEKINQMYDDVQKGSNDSASDLKILLDLKRCWNGRCSLYWDSPDFLNDNHPDRAIVPGGVAGSRDIERNRLSEIHPSHPILQLQFEAAVHDVDNAPALAHSVTQKVGSVYSHGRHISAASAQDMPGSTTSVQSVQANSCSLPSKGPKRGSVLSTRSRGPHPVPVTSTKRVSPITSGPLAPSPLRPIWRRPPHTHKRSGSFSDSVRDDRAPLPTSNLESQGQQFLQALPHAENIIRGSAYPPVEANVDVLAPPSPTLEPSQFYFQPLESPGRLDDNPKPSGPVVKSLIGSIRRALYGRQGGNNSVLHAGGCSIPPPKGKTSTLPQNVMLGTDTYRERRVALGCKTHTRVDLLCDEAAKCYHKIITYNSNIPTKSKMDIAIEVSEKEQKILLEAVPKSLPGCDLRPNRVPSQITMGSKSTVIMDDTGIDLPLMSGALPPSSPVNSDGSQGQTPTIRPLSDGGKPLPRLPISHTGGLINTAPVVPMQLSGQHSPTISRHSSPFEGQEDSVGRRSSMTGTGSKGTLGSPSKRLRKCASYQYGMVKHDPSSSIDTTETSVSGPDCRQDAADKPLARILRRRPGGDLRKIQNVHDLVLDTRPQSSASGTSYTGSLLGSGLYMARNRTIGEPETENLDVETPTFRPEPYSLLRTRSSQHLRPSFEAAIAGFSEIPDDDDGGVESTLLKLEGKWEKPSPSPCGGASFAQHQADSTVDHNQQGRDNNGPGIYPSQKRLEPPVSFDGPPAETVHSAAADFYNASVAESEDSFCSIPLLERGLSDDSMKNPNPRPVHSDVVVPSALFTRTDDLAMQKPGSPDPSIDLVEETESLKRIPQGSTLPRSPTVASLHDNPDYSSEISSEMSVDVIDRNEAVGKTFEAGFNDSSRQTPSSVGVLTHPLTRPPSPPMTMQYPGSMTAWVNPIDVTALRRQPPLTPELSPIGKTSPYSADRDVDVQHPSENVLTQSNIRSQEPLMQISPIPGHIPFILSYGSQVLAQQFTLVEKAALGEVDWKDLVDMRWSNSSQCTRNWADYLSKDDWKGIDLVVARFNLMVKWVLSEIMLTPNMAERAQVIIKYIHIAAHARRIRNYSTMLQIAIALSSVDCTRLTKTWELVPGSERRLLKDMESMIQPVRNFHKLRLEMETTNLQEGCIPFVGLYVQDLTYNSQKPAQIASTRDGEPLVNFERYRTAATIVKSLLRLIDASTKYIFEPVHGVIERCLWVAALTDERIAALSKGLE